MKNILFFSLILLLSFTTNLKAKTTIKLLEVITSPERTAILRDLLDEFEAANSDIEVQLISIAWDGALEKLVYMAGSTTPPDVMEMPDRWLALLAGGGLLANLEPKIKKWSADKVLQPKIMKVVRYSNGIYTLPYGLYLRAMFYNKALLKQAGIKKIPHTMAEFMKAVEVTSKLPGKTGYCFRGGFGGINGWFMMAAAMNGSSEFFTQDGKSRINEPGSVAGIQFMLDLYQKGYVPKESIDWDFAAVVSNFASGRCAFLDQDPDALNIILKTMDADEFAVTTMPVGPSGKAFPTLGFAGWSISSSSKKTDEAWRLISFLMSREQNLKWVKEMETFSIYADLSAGVYGKDENYRGWFKELSDEAYQPMIMPTYLEQFGNFEYSIALFSSKEALQGLRTAQEIADLWAAKLTAEFAKWKKQNKK